MKEKRPKFLILLITLITLIIFLMSCLGYYILTLKDVKVEVFNVEIKKDPYAKMIISNVSNSIKIYTYYSKKVEAGSLYLTINDDKRLALKFDNKINHLINNFDYRIINIKSMSSCDQLSTDYLLLTEDGKLYILSSLSLYDNIYNKYKNDTTSKIDMVIYEVKSDYKITNFTNLIDGITSCGYKGEYVLTADKEYRLVDINFYTKPKVGSVYDGHVNYLTTNILDYLIYADSTIGIDSEHKIVDSNNKPYIINKSIYAAGKIKPLDAYYAFITSDNQLIYTTVYNLTTILVYQNGKKVTNVELKNTTGNSDPKLVVITFEDNSKLQLTDISSATKPLTVRTIDDLIKKPLYN